MRRWRGSFPRNAPINDMAQFGEIWRGGQRISGRRYITSLRREEDGCPGQTSSPKVKFSTLINPKDGYAVVDCKDPRERRVLEFVVSILYPEKPTQVAVTISNTIFGALSRARLVTWRVVM